MSRKSIVISCNSFFNGLNEGEVLRMAEYTATAAPQEERKDRKSRATLPLSDYPSFWSRNEGEVLRMAEQTPTAAPQTESLTSQIY
jgi:hypothetical protein